MFGALRRPIRFLVFWCNFRVSWAVRYGFRRVFAFSVKAMEAFVFRLSHESSGGFGESGNEGSSLLCVDFGDDVSSDPARFVSFMVSSSSIGVLVGGDFLSGDIVLSDAFSWSGDFSRVCTFSWVDS